MFLTAHMKSHALVLVKEFDARDGYARIYQLPDERVRRTVAMAFHLNVGIGRDAAVGQPLRILIAGRW